MTQPAPEVETFAVLTGPIKGTVTLADGTVYSVDDYAVPVASAAHAAELADAIGNRYAIEGHPDHMYTNVPFVHNKEGV